MGTAIPRQARGGLCVLTAIVLVAVLGGFAHDQHRGAISHPNRIHQSATPWASGAQLPGFDLVVSEGPATTALTTSADPADGPGPAVIDDCAGHRGRDPPADLI